jgi:hypothetical protein
VRFIIHMILASCVFSCVSKSGEDEAQISGEPIEAGKVVCGSWQPDKDELDLVQLLFPIGSNVLKGVVRTSTLRSGASSHGYVGINMNGTPDNTKAVGFQIAKRSQVLGLLTQKNIQDTLFATNYIKSRSTLEARQFKNGVVIGQSDFFVDGKILDADLEDVGEDLFMSLRTSDYSTSFAKARLVGEQWKFDRLSFGSEVRGARYLATTDTKLSFVVEPRVRSEAIQFDIRTVQLNATKVSEPLKITIAGKGGVESIALRGASGGILYAAVFGDSMVGQGRLSVGRISISQSSVRLDWSQDIALPDVHLSEVVWVDSQTNPIVSIFSWLDGDAVLKSFVIERKTLRELPTRGPFKRGSSLGSIVEQDGQVMGVLRQRRNDFWSHQICTWKAE